MVIRRATVDDVAWMVARLSEQRARLVSFAPVLWRPAADAAQRHQAFLIGLLTDNGVVAYRSDAALMIAQPGRHGWLLDDVAVDDDAWTSDGKELWQAITAEMSGRVRFVCLAPETARRHFAQSKGFRTS